MRILVPLSIGTFLLVGCSTPTESGEPPLSSVASVEVTPASGTVSVGSSIQLAAVARDASGAALSVPIRWATSNSALATIGVGGLLSAVTPGTVTVTAAAGASIGAATITIPAAALSLSSSVLSLLGDPTLGNAPVERSVLLTNAGDGVSPAVALGAIRYLGATTGWLTARLASAAAPTTLTVTLATAGLPPGTYSATVGLTSVAQRAEIKPLQVTFSIPAAWEITTGDSYSCARKRDGTTYCWGRNDSGQLGDGTTTDRPVPTLVPGSLRFAAITAKYRHTCGITFEGIAYCWGNNLQGGLGDGTRTNRLLPTRVSGINSFTRIAAGYDYTCGLRGDAKVLCWGNNDEGELGDGTRIDRTAPVVVGGSDLFVALAPNEYTTCALTTLSEAKCWGYNIFLGVSGGGVQTNWELAPKKMDLDTTFIDVVSGRNHSCARRSTGEAFCWGLNTIGEYGSGVVNGSYVAYASRVAGGLQFAEVMGGDVATCGRTVTNDLYCWGRTLAGVSITPALVLSSVAQASVGTDHWCAVTMAGAAVCWGNNARGQLGDGQVGQGGGPRPVLLP